METEVEELRLSQIETDDNYVSLNNEYSQLKSSITIADSAIKNLRQKDAELLNEQGRLKTEIEESQEKISSMRTIFLRLYKRRRNRTGSRVFKI
jgi:predicted  nucleic acid-binding Zn-ribbon protein